NLEWGVRDDPDRCRALGLFILGSCNRNDCLAYDPHYIYMNAPAGDYWIIVDGRDNSTIAYTLTIHCGDNPLPVELTSFDAVSEENGVHLRWTVASELDNDGFEIQRSNADSEDWVIIGYVRGRGTVSSSATYNFVDVDVVASRSYTYRLLSVGVNGEQETLGLVSATYTSAEPSVASEFRFLGNYPNPFNPSTLLRFETAEASEIAIEVFDVQGRLVSRLLSGVVAAGVHEVSFHADGLPSGLYLARLRAGSNSDLLKMILLK
ncbi:T9SS type A sorting domain-containing protein, partial [bacterium]|nr:T9SS type A sorting domain-containing protein [bacterium]MBU1983914.1 T9SS type A sorting domain-containing protein [bacterium]